MNFNKYLEEKLGILVKNLIVVDIQPLYEDYIKTKFSIIDFGDFINQSKNKILYFYNGKNTIDSDDTDYSIMDWLIGYNDSLENFNWKNVNFYDKGYSFFRDWMDAGVSSNGMKIALRYMYMNRKYDSRDISVDEWKKVLPEKDFYAIGDSIEDGGLSIWTPDISVSDLKNEWNGSLICGGGENECLKEILLLLSTFNIKYTMVERFIY